MLAQRKRQIDVVIELKVDETILLATGAEADHLIAWLAAAGTATAMAALSAWLLRRRRSRNRRSSATRV